MIMAEVVLKWKAGASIWSLSNLAVAETLIQTDNEVVNAVVLIGGISVPWGVGWVWHRQWRRALLAGNQLLREQLDAEVEGRRREAELKERAYEQLEHFRLALMAATDEVHALKRQVTDLRGAAS